MPIMLQSRLLQQQSGEVDNFSKKLLRKLTWPRDLNGGDNRVASPLRHHWQADTLCPVSRDLYGECSLSQSNQYFTCSTTESRYTTTTVADKLIYGRQALRSAKHATFLCSLVRVFETLIVKESKRCSNPCSYSSARFHH